MEDSQSATGFRGEVGNVTFPGKVMADSETQKLERKWMGVFSKRSFRRDIVRV